MSDVLLFGVDNSESSISSDEDEPPLPGAAAAKSDSPSRMPISLDDDRGMK